MSPFETWLFLLLWCGGWAWGINWIVSKIDAKNEEKTFTATWHVAKTEEKDLARIARECLSERQDPRGVRNGVLR